MGIITVFYPNNVIILSEKCRVFRRRKKVGSLGGFLGFMDFFLLKRR